MTIDPEAAAKAAELQALHDQFHSWRKVQRLHFPKVPAGTLNRIAKSGGQYLPKDRKLLRALGLVQGKVWLPGERKTKRGIAKMAKETMEKVLAKKGNNDVRK